MAAYAEPLSASERDGLPALWAAQDYALAKELADPEDVILVVDSTMPSKTGHEHQCSPWTSTMPLPYETRTDSPIPRVKSTPARTREPIYPARRPSTPPRSITDTDLTTREPSTRKPVALPGTMSSRGNTPGSAKYRSRSTPRIQPATAPSAAPHSRTLSRRIKIAFTGAFRRTPVDESALEYIGAGDHWTEGT
ncbi:hypothetical protein LTR35_009730 [Friedmanniomyces endolithicus]|uniref:Uncharacterized protein n=1 Tax=Friedmanniomyces endolithicus TaxID=329885 RepID=A0AAN6FPN1_9PEZI|nr:hypothetical protein LTR35_009730 [Friedmanniomyces endolithicus]KAK0321348.1 hypothetical protein LTR82_007800 [Friedmanniomyces endolithicus]KAK1018858.1 hypothetical protein LTR54_000669 [Friedmanniomyces endolithicus]